MAKSPPKLLRYNGTVYEQVPLRVRYAGKTYVIAQNPMAPGPAELTLPAVPSFDPAAGQQMGKEMGQEVAPEIEKTAPVMELQKQLVKEEDIKKTIQPMIDALNDEAQKYLAAVGVKTSGDFTIEAIERDGLDIKVPIHTGNFAKMPTETAVYFDFMVKLPGAEDVEEQARGEQVAPGKKRPPGEWTKGEHLFIDKLWSAVENTLDSVSKRLDGSKALQEISVGLCDKFLMSKPRQAESLLESVAFLQNVPKVEAGELQSIPEGEPGSEDSKAWLADFLMKLREGNLEKITSQRYHMSNLFKRDQLREVLEVLGAERILAKQIVDTANAVLDTFADDGEYAEWVGALLKGDKSAARMSREKVEQAVRALAAHEGYKDSAPVRIGTDPDTGNVIAKIDVPGNLTYVFRKSAGTAPPQFLEAEAELCGFKWVVTSTQDAMQLLTAVADVAEAAQNSADPSLSEDREEGDMAKILRMVETRKRQVEEEKRKLERAQPQEQRPPATDEFIPPAGTEQTPAPSYVPTQ
jgi:hypothetical protein